MYENRPINETYEYKKTRGYTKAKRPHMSWFFHVYESAHALLFALPSRLQKHTYERDLSVRKETYKRELWIQKDPWIHKRDTAPRELIRARLRICSCSLAGLSLRNCPRSLARDETFHVFESAVRPHKKLPRLQISYTAPHETSTFTNLLHVYDGFHWKCYTPKIHQIEQLKSSAQIQIIPRFQCKLFQNPNFKIPIWIWSARYRGIWVSRSGGFRGSSIFSGNFMRNLLHVFESANLRTRKNLILQSPQIWLRSFAGSPVFRKFVGKSQLPCENS